MNKRHALRPSTRLPKPAQGNTIRSPFGRTPGGGIYGQAQMMTQVKYGPEAAALGLLLRQAKDNYRTSIAQNRAAAELIQRSVREQAPLLADQTARLTAAEAAAHQTIAQAAGSRGGTIPQNEADLAAHQLGLSGQAAQASMAQAAQRAAEAAAFQNQAARGQYEGDVAQIGERRSSLGHEAGDYASLAIAQLLGEHRQRVQQSRLAQRKIDADNARQGQSIATQLLTHGIDEHGQVIPGSPTDLKLKADAAKAAAGRKANIRLPGGAKPLPTSQQNKIISDVHTVAQLVRNEVGKPAAADIKLNGQVLVRRGQEVTSGAIRRLLTTAKNPLGRAFDANVVNAAFDVGQLGGLSPANVRALHGMGLPLKGRLPIADRKSAARRRSSGSWLANLQRGLGG